MSSGTTVSEVRFHAASARDDEQGLAGWATFIVDGRFRLSSVAVRRTLGGRWTLSFPARLDRAGQQWFYFRPIDDRTRRDIESQVFAQLGLTEGTLR